MRSIQRRFKKISKRHPLWTSYICFAQAIHGQKFTQKVIYSRFSKLVDTDDYDQGEKYKVLRSLVNSEPP